MDGTRFDALTRIMTSCTTRRATGQMLTGAVIGALVARTDATDARKKACKGGRKKCGKKCCPRGQFCRNGTCSICARPLLVCPDGGCAKTLCGGRCCAVAETCVDNQCVPCPDLVNSCGVDVPRCNNGSGFCATSVDGGTFCVSAARTCSACTTDTDCDGTDGFAICGTCTSCGGTNTACFLPLPE